MVFSLPCHINYLIVGKFFGIRQRGSSGMLTRA
jgi:hypothetical protein